MEIQEVPVSAGQSKANPHAAWFTQQRFGMFVHFGINSIPAGVWKGVPMGRNWYAEWIQMQGNWPKGIPAAEYQALTKQFNPVKFDADAWVREAKNAGMGSICITSKHHDGFALWPSKVSAYNVMNTPFKRDILGELSNACAKHGMKFACYYSHWLDWEHPGGGLPHPDEFKSEPRHPKRTQEQFEKYWQEKCLPQVRELIENYHPAFLWFDTWAANSSEWITEARMDELIGLIRRLDPTCLINSRLGTWGHSKGYAAVDFISMMDNHFPEKGFDQPWETSGTMNRSWACHQLDHEWHTAKEILTFLIKNASRGGNYQLNVGPLPTGELPVQAIRRLREIGAWWLVNGEAVRGTEASDLQAQKWGFVTKKKGGGMYYLHVLEPRAGAEIVVRGLRGVKQARVLETGQALDVLAGNEHAAITLPAELRENNIAVVAVEV